MRGEEGKKSEEGKLFMRKRRIRLRMSGWKEEEGS